MTNNRIDDNPNFRRVFETHKELYGLPEKINESDLNFYEFNLKNSLEGQVGVMISVPLSPRGQEGHNSASYHRYCLTKDTCKEIKK